MNKRLYILFFSLVVLTSVFIWRKPLTSQILKTSLKYFTENALGEKISFYDFKHENHKITLHEPQIGLKSQVAQKGGVYLEAEAIEIEYEVEWFKRSIKLNVSLTSPKIDVVKTQTFKPSLASFFSQEEGWLQMEAAVKADQGQLTLMDLTDPSEPHSKQYQFSLESRNIQQGYSVVSLHLSDKVSTYQGLLSLRPESENYNFDLKNVQAEQLQNLIYFWASDLSRDERSLKCSEGIIDGSIDVSNEVGYLPRMQAHLSISDLHLDDDITFLSVKVPKLDIHLQTAKTIATQSVVSTKQLIEDWIDLSQGEIKIPLGTQVLYQQNQIEIIRSSDMKGEITFNPKDPLKLHLEGNVSTGDRNSLLTIDGSGSLTMLKGDLSVKMKGHFKEEARIRCSINPYKENEHQFYAQLSHFSEDEADFLKQLLRPFYAQVQNVEILKGQMDLSMNCQLKNLRPKQVHVEDFQLLGGAIRCSEWIQSMQNVRSGGRCSFDLGAAKPLSTLQGEIHFETENAKIKNYELKDLEGVCTFEAGAITMGQGKAQISDLLTKIQWDSQTEENPLQIHVSGAAEKFLDLAPEMVSKGYLPLFKESQVALDVNGSLEGQTLQLKGKCQVGELSPAFFGFNVIKREAVPSSNEPFFVFWNHFITPLKTVPVLSYFERQLKVHLSSNFTLQNGWFTIQKAPVEKLISPIVFADTSLKLNGFSDLKGEFDQQGLSLSYDQLNLSLTHPTFEISFKNESGSKVGRHYFNFNKGTHFGHMHLSEGSLSLPGTDLLFENMEGPVEITSEYVFAPTLKAQLKNLPLSANFKLRFSMSGDLDLNLKLNEFEGPLSEMSSLFDSLGYAQLSQAKLSGMLKVEDKCAEFELKRRKEDIQTRIIIEGKLADVKTPFLNQQSLDQVQCGFFFDSASSMFELKDFQGRWRSHRKQEYFLHSKYLKLNIFDDEPCHFDVKVKNAYKDYARLSGKLYLKVVPKKTTVKVVLDQANNHIGSVDLTNVYFSLNESFQLDYLNVNFAGHLKKLQNDLSFFQTMVPQMPATSVTVGRSIEFDGDISGQWVYDLSQKRHQFFVWGEQVKIADLPSGFFQLKGSQQNNLIIIEDLTYHDLTGSFTIEEKPYSFFLRKGVFYSKDAFRLEASGIYCKIFNSCQIDVQDLYGHMGRLKQNTLFSAFPHIKDSSGELKIKGKLEGGIFKGDISYGFEFLGSTKHFTAGPIEFKDDQITGRIAGNSQMLKLENFKGHFAKVYEKPLDVYCQVKDMEVKKDQRIKISNIHFSLPTTSLEDLRQLLKEKWDLVLPQEAYQMKQEGQIEGDIYYNDSNPNFSFGIHFSPGKYHLFDKDLFLNECALFYGSSGLKVSLATDWFNKPYWVVYSKTPSQKNAFSLSLLDHNPKENFQKRLKIQCEQTKEQTVIKSISGALSGMRFDFVHRPEKDTETQNVLMGQLQMNGEKIVEALPASLSEKLGKLQLGKGYFLTGQLKLNKEDLTDFMFEGLFGGQDFELFGYEFKSLSSSVQFSKFHLLINDLKLSDRAGELVVPFVEMDKQGFAVPKVKLSDFKPSLLHQSIGGPVRHKPLIIDEAEITNLKGQFSDLNTIRGDGFLTFQKSPKKQTSLLDIPAHLISKLGLDLTMLNPVEGKVMFLFKDQKIIITKLVDVYSNDRHCHFTLAKQPESSYLDFQGHLNVKIKMKQYVLLKFTEPYIISVQGPFSAPHYSFMRKKVVVNVNENTPL